jgi:DNA-directed RNA polymerase specialized sigma24 family protein
MSFEHPGLAEAGTATPSDARAHGSEEVEQAIRALTAGDFKKLRAVAYALVRGLDLETAGRDHEDLYSEALTRTLAGSRAWRSGVDFRHHLAQAMRSIAWTWREYEDRRAQAGLVASPPQQGGHPEDDADAEDPMDPPAPDPDLETAYLTSRELARFRRRFRNDRPADVVMHGWQIGESMKELSRRTGITTQDLQWAARRIRRFAQKGRPLDEPTGDGHDRGDSHGH